MDITRLKELYEKLDELKQSGRDVVYEIEKEVNNIELGHLQENIIPYVAKILANKLKQLKCQVEVSLQYDGNGAVKYSFGKSGSMVLVQDEVKSEDEIKPVIDRIPIKKTSSVDTDLIFGSMESLTGYKIYLKNKDYKAATYSHYIGWLLRIMQNGIFTRYGHIFDNCRTIENYTAAIDEFINIGEIKALNAKSHNSLRASLKCYVEYICSFETPVIYDQTELDSSERPTIQRNKPKQLRVTYPTGEVVAYGNSTQTFVNVISNINPQRIKDIGILHSGINLVMDKPARGLEDRQKFLAPHWYIYVNLNTNQKADDLRKISEAFNLNLRIDVINLDEENTSAVVEPETAFRADEELRSSSSYRVYYNTKSNIQSFIDAFSLMKTYTKNGIRSPQKAILLISIFTAIRDNLIRQNQIRLNGDLMTLFNYYWNRLVPVSFPFESNICQPYVHLDSDPFYNLHLKKPIANINVSWTLSLIARHCDYAELAPELYTLAIDRVSCQQLIDALVDAYQLIRLNKPAKNSNLSSSVKLSAIPTERGFRSFLTKFKSETTHRVLSPSSISVYASGTRSDYIIPFVRRYEKTGDLFRITDTNVIDKLIADVTNDISLSNRTSRIPIYMLKLYLKYIQSMK